MQLHVHYGVIMTTRLWKKYHRNQSMEWWSQSKPTFFNGLPFIENHSTIGADDPHHVAKEKMGVSAVNQLDSSHQFFIRIQPKVNAVVRLSPTSVVNYYTDTFPGYVVSRLPSASLTTEADSKAKIEVIKKLRDAIDGPTTLGELKETIEWFAKPGHSLRVALLSFFAKNKKFMDVLDPFLRADVKRRLRKKALRRYAKDVADAHLELTFAVRPLLGLISDLADVSIARLPGSRLKRVSATVPANSDSSTESEWTRFGTGPFEYRYTTLQKNTSVVCYGVWVKETVPEFEDLLDRIKNQSNMRWGEIPGVIWEVTTLSWMVDYFCNIGDLLACNFDYNANVAFGYKGTTRMSTDCIVGFKKRPYGSYDIVSSSMTEPYFLSYNRVYNRSKISAIPGISPMDFHFDLPGCTDQFLNIGAVLMQKLDTFINKSSPLLREARKARK